jgi:arginine/lysine/ornithine decarboxylase
MFHTTSPSYLMMASLEASRKMLATQGEEIFGELVSECRKLKEEISKIPGLSVLDENKGVVSMIYDPTKIVINITNLGLDGFDVYDIMFEKYGIQLELAEPTIVLAVIGIGDTKETVWGLAEAFRDLAETYYGKYEILDIPEEIVYVPPQIMSPRQAFYADKTSIKINEAVGRVAAETVMLYPPGIPICIPGELITAETVDEILYCQVNSNCVQKDSREPDLILVVVDDE